MNNSFLLNLSEKRLLHAPLHGISALVNEPLASQIGHIPRLAPERIPQQRKGEFVPDFLGLIPTRDCNLACRYCSFRTQEGPPETMSPELAESAIAHYAELMARHGRSLLNIHFFGGEPFVALQTCKAAVEAGHTAAQKHGLQTVFEAATNGFMSRETAEFVSNSIDFIVLSLDGPPEFQNAYRPRRNGAPSFDVVQRNAKILSAGPGKFCIRCCVTSESVSRMPGIARWLYYEFHPAAVSFETLQVSPESKEAGIHPPDPWEFAMNFIKAESALQELGVSTIYATAEIDAQAITFCPVGKDAAIVSPDGSITGCYLLEKDWQARGMDLRLGMITTSGKWILKPGAIEEARACNVLNKSRCKNCFCKWHCAGGCHVNHTFPGCGNQYDDLCIQTRIISLFRLLKRLHREDLFDHLAADQNLLKSVIEQDSDLLPV